MPTETIEIPTDDGVADAYLARPGDGDRHPGVLFMMDGLGLRPRIAEMAERIASRGYIVLAPNAFYRGGHAPVVPVPDFSEPESRASYLARLRPLIDQLTPDAVARDGAAYLDYLADVAGEPVAISGYCLGARLAVRIAEAYPDRIVAIAGFHGGGLVTDAPDSPHLGVGSIRAEVYFGHADNDQSNTPAQIATLERALDEAGVGYRAEVYEGALHGYTMTDMPVYDEAAAERHFRELFALLDRTLGAG